MPSETTPGTLDAFLNVQGIKGESTDSEHRDQIEVLTFSWGLAQRSGSIEGRGRAADFDELVVTKVVDTASPHLYRYCALGKRIPKVTLDLCAPAGEKRSILKIELEGVLVSRVELCDRVEPSGPPRPVEKVGFRYNAITWTYSRLDHSGRPKGTVTCGWDLTRNAPK